MNDQIQQLEIQYLKTRIAQLEVERDYLKENVGMLVEETFSLGSMLDAIGAGGVGASIQPQAQPDTAQIPDVRIRTSAPDAPQPPAAQQNPVGYMRWKNGSAEYVSVKRWEVPFDGDWHTIYTTPQPTENLRCKSTQKRLAMLWGYVKQEPARQPLTDEQIMELAEPFGAFEYGDAQGHKRQAFVRAIEEAVWKQNS